MNQQIPWPGHSRHSHDRLMASRPQVHYCRWLKLLEVRGSKNAEGSQRRPRNFIYVFPNLRAHVSDIWSTTLNSKTVNRNLNIK